MNLEAKIVIAEKNKAIPTCVIRQDISDTQAEIATMEREIKGFRLVGDRMSNFRADAHEGGIKERRDFIEKLNAILEIRAESPPQV